VPDAQTIALADQVARLGAGALLVIFIGLLLARKLRTEGEVKENDAKADARLAEMRGDRDAWKNIATSSLAKLDRLTDLVETLTGKKLSG
jgi:hypothetical protein